MDKAKKRILVRKARAERVRKTLSGSAERPRLCIRRSLKHIYAQIVDDAAGKSLAQIGSTAGEIAQKSNADKPLSKTAVAKLVGEAIAEKAKAAGIQKVVFDRKGYVYKGRVKALAEAARSKGLSF